MILSDRELKAALQSGRLVVDPLGEKAVQPSSIDLRIGRHFRVFANTRYPYIDVKKPMEDLTELVEVVGDEAFILHPGEFVLGTTLERVEIPNDLVGRLEGKSSLGRLGLLIHSTAGFVDAGFRGNLTLELSNVANLPITLYTAMKIGQISLFQMSSPAETPYGSGGLASKYLDQVGPTPSRYWENFGPGPESSDR
jgi:dCTP deaminase